jgi:hypothetical protein
MTEERLPGRRFSGQNSTGYEPVRASEPSTVSRESSNLNCSDHELCNIEQSAFIRPRKYDLCLLKKQWQDSANVVPTTILSKAESKSQEYS